MYVLNVKSYLKRISRTSLLVLIVFMLNKKLLGWQEIGLVAECEFNGGFCVYIIFWAPIFVSTRLFCFIYQHNMSAPMDIDETPLVTDPQQQPEQSHDHHQHDTTFKEKGKEKDPLERQRFEVKKVKTHTHTHKHASSLVCLFTPSSSSFFFG